jgi:hypothetical protein
MPYRRVRIRQILPMLLLLLLLLLVEVGVLLSLLLSVPLMLLFLQLCQRYTVKKYSNRSQTEWSSNVSTNLHKMYTFLELLSS